MTFAQPGGYPGTHGSAPKKAVGSKEPTSDARRDVDRVALADAVRKGSGRDGCETWSSNAAMSEAYFIASCPPVFR